MLLSDKIAQLKQEAQQSSNHVVVSRLNQALVTQLKLEQSQTKKDSSEQQDSSTPE